MGESVVSVVVCISSLLVGTCFVSSQVSDRITELPGQQGMCVHSVFRLCDCE
jgi:hypothetical protein